MSRNDVGEIFYFFPYHVNWKVSRISDLLAPPNSRIRSPKFCFFNESMKFDTELPKFLLNDADAKTLKLTITTEVNGKNAIYYAFVEVTDESSKIIDVFGCLWNNSHRVFNGSSLIKRDELSLRRKGEIPNGHLRLFCISASVYFRHMFVAPTHNGGRNATNSLANSNSANTSANSSMSTWDCKACLNRNPLSFLNCVECKRPKSKRIKNAAAASLVGTNSATISTNSVLHDWKCTKCLYQNLLNEVLCIYCGNCNPDRIQYHAATSLVNSNPGVININSISLYNWKCNICFLKNNVDKSTCVYCGNRKPDGINNQSLVKLSDNLKDLFTQKKDTDFTIKVQEREFSVHRPILRARSPVFDAMLSHDFTENSEHVIQIEDCEPEVFEEFLLFIYSGKIGKMTCDNAFGLYSAADKYDVPDLKPECIIFLVQNLSLENICEVTYLAIKHNETELLNVAINYFAKNMDEILCTCKWMMFLKENPVEANELCIKALKLGYKKKSSKH